FPLRDQSRSFQPSQEFYVSKPPEQIKHWNTEKSGTNTQHISKGDRIKFRVNTPNCSNAETTFKASIIFDREYLPDVN
ncbi:MULTISPECIES: hypothetical protein, partial [unclassified Limnospira]|uniref:hypothetical protein n=1 Tax=unclassified Limnospira TaxID=2642885 RepID=UPI0028E0D907